MNLFESAWPLSTIQSTRLQIGGQGRTARSPARTSTSNCSGTFFAMASNRVVKAILDRVCAAVGLVLTAPVLLCCAVAIAIETGLPIFYSQIRVGRNNRPFRIFKLRSMRSGVAGTRITAGADPRVTRVGRVLRRYKFDELPQLWNVLKGDMSFVGPRPELPDFVDPSSPQWKMILSVKPGITDLATLIYRDEETLLVGHQDAENAYREVVLPAKLALSAAFLQHANLWTDGKLIACTVYYSLLASRFDAGRVLSLFAIRSDALTTPNQRPGVCSNQLR